MAGALGKYVLRSEENPASYAFKWCVFGGLFAFGLLGVVSTVVGTGGLSLLLFVPFLYLFAVRPMIRLAKEHSAFKVHGTLELALEEAPVLGGRLKGRVRLPPGTPRIGEVQTAICCTVRAARGHPVVLAYDTRTVGVRNGVIDVDLGIAAAAPSSGRGHGGAVTWKLTLEGKPQVPGGLHRNFEIRI